MARRSASGRSESSRTRAGKSALGEPADEDAVEVEAEPERDVTHEQAVAESPDAAEVGVELELERAAEHVEPGRGLDGVEPGEPGERGLDLVGRPVLDLGPLAPPVLGRQVVAHEAFGPAGEVAPAGAGVDGEVADHARRRTPGARGSRRARARSARGAARGR